MSNTPKVRTMSGYSFSYRPASEEEHEDATTGRISTMDNGNDSDCMGVRSGNGDSADVAQPAADSGNPPCVKCGRIIQAGEKVWIAGTGKLEHDECPAADTEQREPVGNPVPPFVPRERDYWTLKEAYGQLQTRLIKLGLCDICAEAWRYPDRPENIEHCIGGFHSAASNRGPA